MFFFENTIKDHISTGIIGASSCKGSDPPGNKSYICSGWLVSAVCWICSGLLPCDTEMDGSFYLLCCWSRGYRYSHSGCDTGGNDRQFKRKDFQSLSFNKSPMVIEN